MPFRLTTSRPLRKRTQYAPGSELEYEVPLVPDVESASGKIPDSSDRDVSLARIYLLSVVNFGITAAWALEMAVITPYFASALRSGPVLSHVVWVLGPISGLLVAPLVGRLSDNCTSRLGRRRPFIVAGAIGTFCGMIVFSNAREIAAFMFPRAERIAVLVIAVGSFAVTDFALNTSMLPGDVLCVHASIVRALQGDIVPERQQHAMQSAAVVMGSLGDFSVNFVLMRYKDPVMHLRFLFLLTAMAYFCTSITMIFAAREEQYKLPESDYGEKRAEQEGLCARLANVPKGLFVYLRGIPGWLWRVGGAFALGFFAFFCFLPNASAWLGSSVLQGDPEGSLSAKKRYELGMAVVGTAGTVRALLSLVTAAAYPRMLNVVNPDQLLAMGFLLYGVIILLFAGTHSLFWGQFAVAVYAIPRTLLLTILPALTMKNSTKANRGKHLGSLCIFAVIPQLIDTTYTGWVSREWGEAWVMRIGGLWSLLAAVFAAFVLRSDV